MSLARPLSTAGASSLGNKFRKKTTEHVRLFRHNPQTAHLGKPTRLQRSGARSVALGASTLPGRLSLFSAGGCAFASEQSDLLQREPSLCLYGMFSCDSLPAYPSVFGWARIPSRGRAYGELPRTRTWKACLLSVTSFSVCITAGAGRGSQCRTESRENLRPPDPIESLAALALGPRNANPPTRLPLPPPRWILSLGRPRLTHTASPGPSASPCLN